jgi:hypothetical protein
MGLAISVRYRVPVDGRVCQAGLDLSANSTQNDRQLINRNAQ